MARRYSNLRVFGSVSGSSIAVSNEFILPTSDGSTNQVMQTDGSGNVSWATVSGGTGSGSTSPGGNDGDIQFNNLGTFGGDGNFNWDYGNGNLYFEGGDGQSSTLNVGQLDNSVLGGTGVTRGTSLVYNNSLSGLSANTVFLVGDTGEFLGDNTMITGYLDVNNVANILMTNPYITQLVANRDGYNTLISMQGSRGIDLQTSDSGGTQTARVTIDPTRGVSNFISDGNNFNVSTDSNTPLTITSAITINNEYTLPNDSGSNGQVMTTNGSGVITWETVSGGTGTTINTYTSGGTYSGDTIIFTNTTGGTYSVTGITSGGSGSTLPAGSSSEIQFNDNGAFGSDSGFTRGVSGESFSVTSTIGTKFFAQAQGDLTAFGLPTEAVGSVYGDDDNTLGIISGDLSGLGLTGIGSVLIASDETSGDTGLIVLKSSQAGIFYDNATSSGGVNLSNDTVGVNLTDNATFNTGLQLTPSVTDVVFENSNGKSEVTLEETGVILKAEDLIVTGGTSGSTEFIVKPVTIQMVNIPAYNDDTAAGVGGLVTGEMFQTTGSGAAPLNAAGILMIKQ